MRRPTVRGVDGREWLADYERRLGELRVRAERVQAGLAGLTGTARSPDGAVTAVVGAGGALRSLELGPRAEGLGRERLAALVVETAAAAAAEAARRAEELVGALRGAR